VLEEAFSSSVLLLQRIAGQGGLRGLVLAMEPFSLLSLKLLDEED
jgi:hypothetical protein